LSPGSIVQLRRDRRPFSAASAISTGRSLDSTSAAPRPGAGSYIETSRAETAGGSAIEYLIPPPPIEAQLGSIPELQASTAATNQMHLRQIIRIEISSAAADAFR